MTRLSSYLITMLVALFWVFRIVVALAFTTGIEFSVQPLNINLEIILLFVTLAAIILIIKRNMIGALIYLISYGLYFGVELYNKASNGYFETSDYTSIFISSVAILLALFVFLDIALSRNNRKGGTKNKETDWFYRTNKYVREKDKREDTNQYRIK